MSSLKKLDLSSTDFQHKFQRGFQNLVTFSEEFIIEKEDWLEPSWYHYKLSYLLLHGKKNVAVEAFRESGKTSLTMFAFPMYRLLAPPHNKFYVMIIKQNAVESGRYIYDMSEQFMNNPFFGWFIKDIHSHSKTDGGAFEITTKKNERIRIEGKGKGGSVRGSLWLNKRPELILLDDVQDMDDMTSPTTMTRDWEWFNSEIKFLSKTGRIFMIGNNLGQNCLIEKVFAHKDSLGFDCLKIPVLDEENKSNWEAKYPTENVLKMKKDFTDSNMLQVFERELMCSSVSQDTRLFDIERLKYYDPIKTEVLAQSGNVYVLTDYAVSTKRTADYRVIMPVVVNDKGMYFVLDCLYGRWDVADFEDLLFKAVRQWQPVFVTFEGYAQHEGAIRSIEQKMVRENFFFRVEKVSGGTKAQAKFHSISALQPLIHNGLVWFPEKAPWLPEMLSELMNVTKNGGLPRHDDLIDCLSYIVNAQKISAPQKKREIVFDAHLIPKLGAY